jgi:hypothetical protein
MITELRISVQPTPRRLLSQMSGNLETPGPFAFLSVFVNRCSPISARIYGVPILIFFLMFGISEQVSAESGPVLPDYESEVRMVFQGMCDGGKVSYSTYYKRGGYVLKIFRSP